MLPTVQAGLVGSHPLIVDIDDLDSDIYESRRNRPDSSRSQKIVAWNQVRQLKRIENDAIKQIDHAWVTNSDDLEKITDRVNASILPNIPFSSSDETVRQVSSPANSEPILLIVGSLKYRVNTRAIVRFLDSVWPSIRQLSRNARFRIVGVGMTDAHRRDWGAVDGVEPVGFVDDLAEEYDMCAATVVPIFEGGGTKIKVVESLLNGRDAVVTTHASRGFGDALGSADGLHVVGDEREMAQRCAKLLNEPERREAAYRRGSDTVRRVFGFEQFAQVVASTVESVTQKESHVVPRVE